MASSRRRLILHDSIAFLTLTAITIALFALTLFLFRSFAEHRAELARQWSDRGRVELERHQSAEAVDALRTALSYAPGERPYELLLAEALAQAGRAEEAYNYFSGLWDAEPGSGLINLQLARLAAAKNDRQAAVNFYRASIYGTWEGDGTVRRRSVRLELVRYLVEQGDFTAAHAELLVAQGNAADDPGVAADVAPLLERMGDAPEALHAYERWAQVDAGNPVPLGAASRIAFRLGEFATAQHLLEEALRSRETGAGGRSTGQVDRAELQSSLDQATRMLELVPSHTLRPEQRISRLLRLRSLARSRLDLCGAMSGGLPPTMQAISDRWQAAGRTSERALRDQVRQDDLLQLVYDTEAEAATACGAPTGDDALLVLLSRDPKAAER